MRRNLSVTAGTLFHAACAVSLLLHVAVLFLWVRGYGARGYQVGYEAGPHRYLLRAGAGELAVEYQTYAAERFKPAFHRGADRHRGRTLYFITRDTFWTRLGFWRGTAGRPTDRVPRKLHMAMAPAWAAALATAALPLAWAARAARWWLGRRRLRSGHCARCGYDLRATPGRCPECGTPADGGGGGKAPAGETPAVT